MSLRAAGGAGLLLLVLPAAALTQIPRPRPQQPSPRLPARPQVPQVPRDTSAASRGRMIDRAGGDTTGRDTTVKWSPPDSIMAELLRRTDYTITRYEGDVVTFDALTKAFAIAAAATRKAQVDREGQHVVTDSTIIYSDRTRLVNVTGRFEIAPGTGQPPIAGKGTATYNLSERAGRLTNATVTVEEGGQQWFIRSIIGKTALGDSARRIPPRFYGLGGTLTSCDDSIPDYHFAMKEVKRTDKMLVARPAVLYIRDIPVMWLPFVFQDIRKGRHSGILPPRFGTSDIVRNNPNYRRHIENLGYYLAINDYTNFTTWFDWRSTAGGDSIDPGWVRLNGEFQYDWLSRFVHGRFAAAQTNQRNGFTNTALSWNHSQSFTRDRRLTMDANYVTSTQLQRQNTFNPYQAMATIRSSLNYTDKVGPASLNVGGSRTQYPGRNQVDQTLPTVAINTPPLQLASWLVWTPNLNFSETDNLRIDQPGTITSRVVPGTNGRVFDTVSIKRNRYYRQVSFGTPLKIFGFELPNNIIITDQLNDFPEEKVVYPGADSLQKQTRVFAKTFRTDIDWNPSFVLPALFPNRFKITPSVTLNNVDPRPFWIRSDLSGGRFVHQKKRLAYGISAAPAIFGLWPGFGPFQRFRHALTPTISYSFAPPAKVDTLYLEAVGERKQNYLGSLAQNAVTLGLSQNIEAKVRSLSDTTLGVEGQGQKIKLLSMQFTPLSYDFERARKTGRRLAGLTTENFGTTMTSDLFPGANFSIDYSLFQGSTLSDTAVFKPFLTRIAANFGISKAENPFAVLTRLFGKAVPERSPAPEAAVNAASPQEAEALRRTAVQPVAGQAARSSQFIVPPSKGWQASFTFSTSRTRRPRGGTVIEFDPKIRCEPFRLLNPFAFEECLRSAPVNVEPIPSTTAGAPYVLMPPQTALGSSLNFELTQKWSAAWQTNYDFEQHQFAAQIVSLQRDLHDWRANFGFTRSPNGNFAFTFFIALKPQPDLKFDYSRASIRNQ